MGQNVVAIFDLVLIPTNTLRGFHVETTWKRSFPRCFNVESTWCVCSVFGSLIIYQFGLLFVCISVFCFLEEIL